jgi:LysR family cys regulon transcriptional activator
MTLQQLRYLAAIVECNLNISAAAQKLHTSQPGVSRQIRVLESELGFELFVREGRALKRLTQQGQRVVERAQRMLRESQAIKGMSLDARAVDRGELSIATTHTQARYVLPSVIERFRTRYPKVKLHLHQGTSEQIADMIDSEHVDLAIATGSHSTRS